MDESNENNMEGSLVDEEDNQIPDIPGDGQKLMIANQSVQQIGEVGHLQEDDMDGEYGESRANLDNQAFGMGYSQENQQVEQIIGHNDAFGQPIDISQDQEDLDAIIESISYGKTQQVKKLQFQAFTAAIAHEDQVKFVVDYLNNVNNTTHSKFPTARNRILAYRVSQLDQISQREVMAEGFDDDGEDGAGEKLLHLLQKMEIENIVLIVCIWNNGVQIGSQQIKGGEFFRIIVERARELLNQIQEQIYQEEIDRIAIAAGPNVDLSGAIVGHGGPDGDKNKRKVVGLQNKMNRKKQAAGDQGFKVQGNNATMKNIKTENMSIGQIDQKIFQHFKQDLTEKDFEQAKQEIDMSITELSKANLLELKSISKPHSLIEKTMQMVCALRGFKVLNWANARDILGKGSFKVELKQTNYQTLKPEDVLRAQNILIQKTNTMLTPENVQIHSQGAALLLVWAANVIKQYAAFKWLGDEITPKPIGYANLSPSYKKHDLQQITIETKIAMRKKNREEADDYEKKIAKKNPKENEEGEEGEDREEGSGDEEVDEDEKERQKAKKEEQKNKDKQRSLQKVGIIGHYLSSKPMVYNMDNDKLEPPKDDGKPKKLIDLNIVKKGHRVHNKYASRIPEDKQLMEDGYLRAEEDRIGKAEKEAERLRKLEEAKRKDEKEQQIEKQKEMMKGGEKKKEAEPEGRLRMGQVQNLPDDVDDMIKTLNEIDFNVQELDILIELSKQLKTKRLQLFPDQTYVFSLQGQHGDIDLNAVNVDDPAHAAGV